MATLHVKALTDGSSQAEGLLMPSLTDDQIKNMPLSEAQKGLMVYNKTMDCIQIYTQNVWTCLQGDQNKYLKVEYLGATGVWMQNISAEENTLRFKVTNQSSVTFSSLNLAQALVLGGVAQGLSYYGAEDYSNVTLAAGESKILTYKILGTPANVGTIDVTLNVMPGFSTSADVMVEREGDVRAMSIAFEGEYVSNKTYDAAQYRLKVVLKNNSSTASLTNADLSGLVSLSGDSGVSLLQGQNTSVSIDPNSEITLYYSLQGIALQPVTLVARVIPTSTVSGGVLATQEVSLFTNVSASSLQINGIYAYNQYLTGENNVEVVVTNNNSYDLLQVDFNNAVALAGARSNLILLAGQNNTVDLPAGQSKTLSYTLSGVSMEASGGDLEATFTRIPFPSLSATKKVQGDISFYATPNVTTIGQSGGQYTFEIHSAEPWVYELQGNASGWITVTGTTGTSGNGTLSISTRSKTSDYSQIGYIKVSRPSDGAELILAINQEPTDYFQITGFSSTAKKIEPAYEYDRYKYYLSIHENNTSTLKVNQSNLKVHGELPSFIKSIEFKGNEIVITPKERTEPGLVLLGTLRFAYGEGYVSSPITIMQNPKAYKCPATPPLHADNGYKIWNSTQSFEKGLFQKQVDVRPGEDDFTDYTFLPGSWSLMLGGSNMNPTVYPRIVKTSTQSLLFFYTTMASYTQTELSFSSIYSSSQGSDTDRHNTYYKSAFVNRKENSFSTVILSYQADRSLRESSENPFAGSIAATPIICADGYDEDTPDLSGDAGWRQ
ncbi:COG1470 family protein [Bergeyella sp. RCAD1439]|uniref:COG1470 family protein n=1 Tax=Bergeyella anatis TaxID=3113737 RepID=UPI002E18673B|nr:hypothetical protein [Bergeyella sp. RCAD1439]